MKNVASAPTFINYATSKSLVMIFVIFDGIKSFATSGKNEVMVYQQLDLPVHYSGLPVYQQQLTNYELSSRILLINYQEINYEEFLFAIHIHSPISTSTNPYKPL